MLNKERIIAQVVNAINVYPSQITIKRNLIKDDGMNGFIVIGESIVANVTGFIDTSNSSVSKSSSDSGNVYKKEKIQLILPYSKDYELMIGDFFIYKDTKYRVKNPNMQFEVCYLAELEVI